MPATTHSATFTWPGNSANTVFVTGAWDNWSGNSHALDKQSDGGFIGHVDLPFGQTYSYKYVVDGEWKTREDEAKEWDAAGNMNNVYTAPAESTEAVAASASSPATATETTPATESTSSAASPASAAAAAAAAPVAAAAAVASQHKSEPAVTDKATVPSTTAPDSTVLATDKSTEPETLLASSTPGPAASGAAALPASERGVAGAKEGVNPSNPLAGFDLGAPIAGGGVSSTATSSFNATPIASTSTPVTIRSSDSTAAVPIPAATATSTSTTEAAAGSPDSYAAQAAAIGGGALAAIGAGALAIGGAVEKVTGIDVIHHPMSVEAAKSAGIDLKSLEKVDAPTHTSTGTSPVPASAVEALEEKIQAVKLDADKSVSSVTGSGPGKSVQHDLPLPSKPAPKTSLPPSGSILPPPKEDSAPKPDLHAQEDNAADHKSVPAPIIKTISPRDPAKDRTSPQTDTAGQADKPISTDPSVSAKDVKKEAEAPPAPPAKSTPAPTPAVVPANLAASTPVAAPTPVDKPVAPAAPVQNPTAVAQAQGVPAASAQPPATPTKTAAAASVASPGSAMSTPAGTPQKSAHARESTTDSDKIRKRKSSFFSKIKERFSSSSPDKQK